MRRSTRYPEPYHHDCMGAAAFADRLAEEGRVMEGVQRASREAVGEPSLIWQLYQVVIGLCVVLIGTGVFGLTAAMVVEAVRMMGGHL